MRDGGKILVTVVTATRNAVQGGRIASLERCIRSVAAIETPHEHLIYDGASTDGTVERLMKWQGEVPDLKVVSEPDTGIYNALNKGVCNAHGDYFYVIGDDDYIFNPEGFDGAVSHVANGDYDMGISPVERDDGRHFGVSPRIMLWRMAYPHQGVIARTDLVRQLNGFDESYRSSGDFDLHLRIHLKGANYIILKDPYAVYSTSGTSSTNKERARAEDARVLCSNLGLDASSPRMISERRLLPILPALKLSWHPDFFIRTSARHQVKRWIACRLGLLNAAGNSRSFHRH